MGRTGPFFFTTWVPKIIRTQLSEPATNINKPVRGTIKQFKVKGLSSYFVLNLRMSCENCLSFNWHSSRAAPGISFFRVPTKDDEYSINWRNNIAAVITRDTIRCWRQFKKKDKLKTVQFELHYPQKNMICHKQIMPTKLHFSLK